ncbi:MAG: methyltransferase domain-containing protein [Planctomycetota bacterium]|nr:methyltransferase domain-containing protein [Planctomycetota bacterium]
MAAETDPFFSEELARRYEAWYDGPGRRADRLEKRLLARLLAEFDGARSILEVGCGTGHFSRWLVDRGYEVTGLDHSPAMLGIARAHGGARFVEGDAMNIPMPPRAMDLVMLLTTLEFTRNPDRALREAVRIARRGVVLGVLNRRSLPGRRRRRAGGPIWSAARLYAPGELVVKARHAAGERLASIRWRTTLFPRPIDVSLPLPWGGFIGLALKLEHSREGEST